MKYFIVDAFTDRLFSGNSAGVCLLDAAVDAQTMQRIAFENNLAETAFVTKNTGFYDLRWFSPEIEIDLCGHATLASGFVLMNFVETESESVEFHTKSGVLNVQRDGDRYHLNFPSRKPLPCPKPDNLEKALGVRVLETRAARDLVALVEDEQTVFHLQPDFDLLRTIDTFGIVVTAKGTDSDFVSRFFAPGAGIPEDPVTGSSHCSLIPYWSEKLEKTDMVARQLSSRGGTLFCRDLGERVEIAGNAALYLTGEIHL